MHFEGKTTHNSERIRPTSSFGLGLGVHDSGILFGADLPQLSFLSLLFSRPLRVFNLRRIGLCVWNASSELAFAIRSLDRLKAVLVFSVNFSSN